MKSFEVVFFRHGIADSTTPDETRALTEEGKRKTRSAAEGLKTMETQFAQILTSPWTRAVQTAEIVADVLALPAPEVLPELAGDRSVAELFEALRRRQSGNLLLVGHQPLLGEAVATLLGASGKCQIDMRKSGACSLTVDAVPPKKPVVLNWMLGSRHLRSL